MSLSGDDSYNICQFLDSLFATVRALRSIIQYTIIIIFQVPSNTMYTYLMLHTSSFVKAKLVAGCLVTKLCSEKSVRT